jgi:uncharacterized membrane protein
MFQLPSIPSWDALHPSISHFPVVLLLVAPVLIFIGLLSPKRRTNLLSMALWFMLIGTVGVFLSAATGDAAKELVSKTPEITKALENHESLGSIARVVFTILTIFLAILQYHPKLLKKQFSPKTTIIFYMIFLLLYTAAALLLYNTAYSGGLLVHKLGVHANIF